MTINLGVCLLGFVFHFLSDFVSAFCYMMCGYCYLLLLVVCLVFV